jgi:hypothetical protein
MDAPVTDSKNGCVLDKDGTKYWFKDGLRHREDGPAVEWADGSKIWYKDDEIHREDGPAVEYPEGGMSWYLNGEYLGWGAEGFWALWEVLTDEQQGNPNLLKYMPR